MCNQELMSCWRNMKLSSMTIQIPSWHFTFDRCNLWADVLWLITLAMCKAPIKFKCTSAQSFYTVIQVSVPWWWCNSALNLIVHDNSSKFSAIVILLLCTIHIQLLITRFRFLLWKVFSDRIILSRQCKLHASSSPSVIHNLPCIAT